MNEQNSNVVQNTQKKWSVVATLYSIWAATFFLSDYGYILLTKYRKAVPLGLILGAGVLQYPAFFVYVIIALCSIPYWIMNHKKAPMRAVIPMLIVCITLIVYFIYVCFIAPHIDGGGIWHKFILFEIERISSK